jgi:hypothetical protein
LTINFKTVLLVLFIHTGKTGAKQGKKQQYPNIASYCAVGGSNPKCVTSHARQFLSRIFLSIYFNFVGLTMIKCAHFSGIF